MRRTLLFAVPFVILLTGCAPAPPGLPPPLAPGLEWAALLLVAIGALVLAKPKRCQPILAQKFGLRF